MNEIKQRLQALRQVMQEEGISAYVIPSADAHLSEYAPDHWLGRTWISGFTGSAGTMLITLDEAALWTDSRYYLQATEELEGSSIQLMKDGMVGTPTITQYLTSKLPKGSIVGADGACTSFSDAINFQQALNDFGLEYRLDQDLLVKAWSDRPALPNKELFSQDAKYSGQTTADRLAIIRQELKKKGTNATIITMLCELAWTFNIRGYDVDYNPVGLGFGFVSEQEAILFTLEEKVPVSLRQELEANGVRIANYHEITSYISSLSKDICLWLDPNRTTFRLFDAVPAHCQIIKGVSVISMLKAVKTEKELAGVRQAMVRDGVALTRFYKWFEQFLEEGNEISEYELGLRLEEFRAKGDLYYGDSFGAIVGYMGHGAIVHYSAEPETSYMIKKEGVLLLDSGGQYNDGTTDITRTLPLDGAPSDQLRRDYTLVLKGHIAIATARFPEGTCGCQLDILARKALWDLGLNYGHGTGHGVGFFLNVHEGPQNIRTDLNPIPMQIGMITSNEPGLYRADEYGIRIENLIVCELKEETEFGRFFGFETLTLCYKDNRMVDKSLLTEKEIEWYNNYQEMVYQKLAPELNAEEQAWLRAKTAKL